MKVALYTNDLSRIGGAEYVSVVLANAFDATVFCPDPGVVPVGDMGCSAIKLVALPPNMRRGAWACQKTLLDFSRYKPEEKFDIHLVTGDWAISAAIKNSPVLWYAHSPLNEIFSLSQSIQRNQIFWKRPLYSCWSAVNRYLTRRCVKRVSTIVCNSQNTSTRVNKYFNRKAMVIPPPIDTESMAYQDNRGPWLSVGRLVEQKRFELQMAAFETMPHEKLVIAASWNPTDATDAQYRAILEKSRPDNVEIRMNVSRDELLRLYAHCKGLLATGLHEDFGITPVEAMAAGKPVVGVKEAGYRETIVHMQTGVLVDEPNPDAIARGIRVIGNDPESYRVACEKRADRYSKQAFIGQMEAAMTSCVSMA